MIVANIQNQKNIVNYKIVILYMLFLAPITISLSQDGASANYLFLLLLLKSKSIKINKDALNYIIFLTISLFVGIIIYSRFDSLFMFRQVLSYFIMLSGALLLFVNLKGRIQELLIAIVFSALLYSIFAIYMIISKGFLTTDIFFIKGGLQEYVTDWPQRYVIVLMFAFFISIGRWSLSIFWPIASIIIATCIFFTFTRAAWISVFIGLLAYFIFLNKKVQYKEIGHRKVRHFNLLVALSILAITIFFILKNDFVQTAFQTFYNNLELIIKMNPNDFESGSSEGERFVLWKIVLNLLITNPISGTGFAGIYLFTNENGSTHNQYIDVLLRTGIIGLIFYLWFWIKIIRYYRKYDISIAAGLMSILFMGLFHETTKLSYGAFIFFMLLNKSYERTKAFENEKNLGS